MKLPFKPHVLALLCCTGILAVSGVLYVKSQSAETPAATVPAPPVAATPVAPPVATPGAAPVATAPAAAGTFSLAQIDQWVAPIALYPDALLSQVLMASTYPANVVQAAQWSKNNPNLQGDAAIQAVVNQPWDASVKSLVAFPQLLTLMDGNPQWVQNVGDAFLAQPQDVMNSVQKLRHMAQQAGTLKSTPEQQVTTSSPTIVNQTTNVQTAPAGAPAAAASSSQPITIQPTNPEVVYVPTYDPSTAYGTWPNTAYPPTYLPPEEDEDLFGDNLVRGLGFGLGIATTYALFSGLDWDDDDDYDYNGNGRYGGGGGNNINIDVDRYNRVSGGRLAAAPNGARNTWQHNPAYRSGVPYQDRNVAQRYNQGNIAANRSTTQSAPLNRDAQRQQSMQQLQQRSATAAAPTAAARTSAAAVAGNRDRDAQRKAASSQVNQIAKRDNYRGYDTTSAAPRRETPRTQTQTARSNVAQQQNRDTTRARASNTTATQRETPRANALSGNDSRAPSWQAQNQRGLQSRADTRQPRQAPAQRQRSAEHRESRR